jgi:hypothetical protein
MFSSVAPIACEIDPIALKPLIPKDGTPYTIG